jgi:hypothetical protein
MARLTVLHAILQTHTFELLFHTRPQLLLHVFIVIVFLGYIIFFFWDLFSQIWKKKVKCEMHHTKVKCTTSHKRSL